MRVADKNVLCHTGGDLCFVALDSTVLAVEQLLVVIFAVEAAVEVPSANDTPLTEVDPIKISIAQLAGQHPGGVVLVLTTRRRVCRWVQAGNDDPRFALLRGRKNEGDLGLFVDAGGHLGQVEPCWRVAASCASLVLARLLATRRGRARGGLPLVFPGRGTSQLEPGHGRPPLSMGHVGTQHLPRRRRGNAFEKCTEIRTTEKIQRMF